MLFKYLRDFLQDCFRNFRVSNVPCLCNSSAHEIAKLGLFWDTGQSMIWLDNPPDVVKFAVDRDYAELFMSNGRP